MEQTNKAFYGTGSTKPPKNHRGIIAALLIVVIFLVSVVTALSIMNIQLFRMLTTGQEKGNAVSFSRSEVQPVMASSGETVEFAPAGMAGQNMDGVFGQYLSFPDGVYVCRVFSQSAAEQAGLQVGDVIVAAAGQPVENCDDLQTVLQAQTTGKWVQIIVYRDGSQITLEICVQ